MSETSTRRRNQRFTVKLEAVVTRGERALTGRVTNASLGGLFVMLGEKPALGERVRIRFVIGGHIVDCTAVVRWHADDGAGVQFDGLRARDVYTLGKYFETLG